MILRFSDKEFETLENAIVLIEHIEEKTMWCSVVDINTKEVLGEIEIPRKEWHRLKSWQIQLNSISKTP